MPAEFAPPITVRFPTAADEMCSREERVHDMPAAFGAVEEIRLSPCHVNATELSETTNGAAEDMDTEFNSMETDDPEIRTPNWEVAPVMISRRRQWRGRAGWPSHSTLPPVTFT
jgi:hypothetical protein